MGRSVGRLAGWWWWVSIHPDLSIDPDPTSTSSSSPPPPSSSSNLTQPPRLHPINRSAKALDRHSAKLCVLARDVDSDEYKTLVTALCKEGNVPLLYIDSREKLGEFVGLAKVCGLVWAGCLCSGVVVVVVCVGGRRGEKSWTAAEIDVHG